MLANTWLRSALGLVVLGSFTGCPGGPDVAGVWTMEVISSCSNPAQTYGLILFPDGSAEFLGGPVIPGAWGLSGNDISISFQDGNNVAIFEGIVSGNSIVVGTYTGLIAAGGCWSATKAVF